MPEGVPDVLTMHNKSLLRATRVETLPYERTDEAEASQEKLRHSLFLRALTAGIVDIVLGGISVGAVLWLHRDAGTMLLMLMTVLTIALILPGVLLAVIACFAQRPGGRVALILGLIVAGLMSLMAAGSLVSQFIHQSPELNASAMAIGLLFVHLGVVSNCVKVLRHG